MNFTNLELTFKHLKEKSRQIKLCYHKPGLPTLQRNKQLISFRRSRNNFE